MMRLKLILSLGRVGLNSKCLLIIRPLSIKKLNGLGQGLQVLTLQQGKVNTWEPP
jgi:hypothetical protein